MSKKLIFRILGALASALIVVSVFVPFVDVDGYSPSLWQSNSETLYFPILIIAFGVLGILLFCINKKTEFAYSATGAILFFIITETVRVIGEEAFRSLGAGYYFLIIGAILTTIMTFLLNLKSNQNIPVKQIENNSDNQTSLLSKIDNLYNGDSIENSITPIQPMNTIVQPIESNIQPMNTIVQPIENVQPVQPITEVPAMQPIPDFSNSQPSNPVLQQFNANNGLEQSQMIQSIPTLNNIQQQVNPVLQQFTNSNELIQNQDSNNSFNGNVVPIQEINTISPIPVIQPQEVVTNDNIPNPVIQEFANSSDLMSQVPTQAVPYSSQQPQNVSAMDIFGQPINK